MRRYIHRLATRYILVRGPATSGQRISVNSIGTTLGMATIAMAMLLIFALASGIGLLFLGHVDQVVVGLAIATGMFLSVSMVPNTDGVLAGMARHFSSANRPLAAIASATAVSAVAPAVIVAFEMLIGIHLLEQNMAQGWLLWGYCYGVLALPLAVRGSIAGAEHRTVNGIQSYAAQVSFVLVSALAALFNLSFEALVVVAAIPMILPFTVFFSLVFADRNALRDVQI